MTTIIKAEIRIKEIIKYRVSFIEDENNYLFFSNLSTIRPTYPTGGFYLIIIRMKLGISFSGGGG